MVRLRISRVRPARWWVFFAICSLSCGSSTSGGDDSADTDVHIGDGSSTVATGFAALLGVDSYEVISTTADATTIELGGGTRNLGTLTVGLASAEPTRLTLEGFNETVSMELTTRELADGRSAVIRTLRLGTLELRIELVADASLTDVVWSTPAPAAPQSGTAFRLVDGEVRAVFVRLRAGNEVATLEDAVWWIDRMGLEALTGSATAARLSAVTADPALLELVLAANEPTGGSGDTAVQALHLSSDCQDLRSVLRNSSVDFCRDCADPLGIENMLLPFLSSDALVVHTDRVYCADCAFNTGLKLSKVISCARAWDQTDDRWDTPRCQAEQPEAPSGRVWQATEDGHGCRLEVAQDACAQWCEAEFPFPTAARIGTGACACHVENAEAACRALFPEGDLCQVLDPGPYYTDEIYCIGLRANACGDGHGQEYCNVSVEQSEVCDATAPADLRGCPSYLRCADDCSACEDCQCPCPDGQVCDGKCTCRPALGCAESFLDLVLSEGAWCDPAAPEDWCGEGGTCSDSCRCEDSEPIVDSTECDGTGYPACDSSGACQAPEVHECDPETCLCMCRDFSESRTTGPYGLPCIPGVLEQVFGEGCGDNPACSQIACPPNAERLPCGGCSCAHSSTSGACGIPGYMTECNL